MKIKRSDNAISQILAASLLLLMALAILSTVYMNYLFYPPPNPAPYVEIVGSLEAGNIVLEHRGGELLDLDTEVMLIIGENIKIITVGDGDYLDDESKEDGQWGIGERLIYTPTENITNLQVEAIVIDRVTDSTLMMGVLQEGEAIPIVSDTLEFDTDKCYEPDIIHVSGNIYAIAYRDKSNHGSLATIEIAGNGNITDTIIDSFEFDTEEGYEPDIIHISGNIYAIAYRDKSNHGSLATIEIADNGNINDTVKDSLEFDTEEGSEPDIIHVSGNIYAIAYRGKQDDGFLVTVEIAGNGDINDTVKDSLEFDTKKGCEPDIIHISSTVYAIAYRGEDNDGFLKTVNIAIDGGIAPFAMANATSEFDEFDCYNPNIICVSGDVYAIAYKGPLGGYLKTVGIKSDEHITSDSHFDGEYIDSSIFDILVVSGYEPNIIHINGDVYAIAHQGLLFLDWGYLRTAEIKSDGQITSPVHPFDGSYLDKFIFDTKKGCEPDIIHISSTVYAIAYRGEFNHGFLKTVQIADNGDIE